MEMTGSSASRVLGRKMDSIPFSAYHVLIIPVLRLSSDTPSTHRKLPEFTSLHSTAAQWECDVMATQRAHRCGGRIC
jgi:hypothetical protein